MKKKQKGFTLIELLIVVAIIGILAAVGAVTIPNILYNAKVKTSTTNHKAIASLISIKFVQCSTGESELIWTKNATGDTTKVSCTANAQAHLADMVKHFEYENYKNAHNTSEKQVYSATGSTPALGRTNLSCSGDICKVYTNTGGGSGKNEVLSASATKE